MKLYSLTPEDRFLRRIAYSSYDDKAKGNFLVDMNESISRLFSTRDENPTATLRIPTEIFAAVREYLLVNGCEVSCRSYNDYYYIKRL